MDIDDVHLHGSVGWCHTFGDVDPTVDMSLTGSDPFTITGSSLAEDALVAHLSASTALREGVHLTTTFGGEVSDNSHAYGINAELRGQF